MSLRRKFCAFTALCGLAILAACGGGSGSGSGAMLPRAGSSSQVVVMSFSGITSLSSGTRALSVSGTTVTLTFNGQVVGTGTLDATGKAVIEIEKPVPAGSTITATAGSTTVTFVLAQSARDTAVMVRLNPDGTLTVTTAGGEQPEASPDPNDSDGAEEIEDNQGNVEMVDDNDGHMILPSNLPIVVTNTCTTITITAKAGQTFSRLRFEENIHDGDGGNELKFDGAFNSPQSFPLIAQSARIEIELFNASGQEVLDVRAPIGAFTAVAGQPTPSPCPSTAPATPSPQPTHS